MRLLALALSFLLCSCAAMNNNQNSAQNVPTYHGATANLLTSHLGKPNFITTSADGNQVYVYEKAGGPSAPGAHHQQQYSIISVAGGRQMVRVPTSSVSSSSTASPTQCTAYEVNRKGVVVNITQGGKYCMANNAAHHAPVTTNRTHP